MKKVILCIVFLTLGILFAPVALLGQTHASNEEIALKESGTVKPPLPRGVPVPTVLPVSAWLDLFGGIFSLSLQTRWAPWLPVLKMRMAHCVPPCAQ